MQSVRLFGAIAYTSSLRYTQYVSEFFIGAANILLSTLLVALFWAIVAGNSDSGVEVSQIVRYYLLITTAGTILFGGLHVASGNLKAIKSGRLNSVLLLPLHPYFYQFAMSVGFRAPFIVIGGLLLPFVLATSDSEVNWVLAVVTIVTAFVINVSLNLMVSSLGFYIIEASGIKNAFNHGQRLLDGTLIPLYFLSESLQSIFFWTPFPATVFIPIQTLSGQAVPTHAIIIAIVWAGILAPVSLWVWRKSLQSYDAVGV